MGLLNRKLILSFLLVLPVFNASAQDLLERMYSEVMDSYMELSYEYTVRVSGVKTVGSGILHSQDGLWYVEGNGVQMWCDGVSLWVADPHLKEVVIENADSGSDYMSNPALLFIGMKKYFNVRMARPSEDGQTMLYVLELKESGDIDYCNLELYKKDASIKSAVFAMTDGNLLEIKVLSMLFSDRKNTENFRPQIEFDSSWIVTDLR